MFIREPSTGLLMAQQASYLGLSDADAQYQQPIQELHAIALTIVQAQQDILAAQSSTQDIVVGDMVVTPVQYVQLRLQDLQYMRNLFAQKVQAINGLPIPGALTAFDNFILAAGNWIDNALQAAPGAIAAIPNAIISGLAAIAGHVADEGTGLGGKILIPVVLGGFLLLALVQRAEKTRTYRKVVA